MTTQIISQLKELAHQPHSMERTFATRHAMRQLYNTLGDPTPEDFPEAYAQATHFARQRGYTTHIPITTTTRQQPVDYRIKRPSDIKQRLIEHYYNAGWDVIVTAYNVTVSRTFVHPRHRDIAITFVYKNTPLEIKALTEEKKWKI